jgi:hypothetical protein
MGGRKRLHCSAADDDAGDDLATTDKHALALSK